MDPACLEFCLTDTQRRTFNEQGYLVVEDALDRAEADRLIEAVDRVDARKRSPDHGANKLFSLPNILPEEAGFLDLVDCPKTFPKVWGILGWNIYLYHTHLDVTPPVGSSEESLDWEVAWHQDSMRVNDEIETHPRPRLSLKIGYYLTDVSEPGRGNTLVVPGSHFDDEIDCPGDGRSNPAGTVPLCVKPGTAVFLDRRLWHSRSPNRSDAARKVLWYGYAYRWLRPKDEMTVAHLYERLDPVRRQILGDGQSANGAYDPTDADVPLRGWLEEHRPSEAERSLHKTSQARPPAGGRGKNTGRE